MDRAEKTESGEKELLDVGVCGKRQQPAEPPPTLAQAEAEAEAEAEIETVDRRRLKTYSRFCLSETREAASPDRALNPVLEDDKDTARPCPPSSEPESSATPKRRGREESGWSR